MSDARRASSSSSRAATSRRRARGRAARRARGRRGRAGAAQRARRQLRARAARADRCEGVPARARAGGRRTCSTTRRSGARRAATVEVAVAGGEVAVRDHGPGIAEADLPYVFDRFYRAPTARGMPGSGLGLAIVRQVAEAHGGDVAVERPADGGTLHAPEACAAEAATRARAARRARRGAAGSRRRRRARPRTGRRAAGRSTCVVCRRVPAAACARVWGSRAHPALTVGGIPGFASPFTNL